MEQRGRTLLASVFITAKPSHPEMAETVGRVVAWLRQQGSRVTVDTMVGFADGAETRALEIAGDDLTMIVVLGGDGTLLHAARTLGARKIPILGINLGSLGFLTETSSREAIEVLASVASRSCRIDELMMLDCRLQRGQVVIGDFTVLNDVVINKGALARIIGVEAHVNGREMTRYRGDGVIISTPTGSTAYSLSAGGPIIYQMMEAIAVTPICPHVLANRPIILPADSELVLTLQSGSGDVYLTLDGQQGIAMEIGDTVEVRRSKKRTCLVHAERYDYYRVLRLKLKWGEY